MDTILDCNWTCSICKTHFTIMRLFKDIVAGKYGICLECQNDIDKRHPELKRERDLALIRLKFGGSI